MNDTNTPAVNVERALLLEGGADALATLLSTHNASLERIISFRLDPKLQSRLDPSDVLQEAYITISRRIQEFIDGVPVSFFVWARQKTIQTLIDMQRTHFREKRDAYREVSIAEPSFGQTSSLTIARYLLDDRTSPSQAAVRAEEIDELQSALESMNETDREILAMRHFEQLNNQQVAEVLGLSPTAASNRYVRAATKLGEILQSIPSKRGSQ
jgi:RNA polymerase sigma-70 factor (ECF subfamily)